MSKAPETVVDKTLSLIREYMDELKWSLGGIEAALNLMYRGLSDKSENDEAIAAIGMLRSYFSGTTQKVRQIGDQLEKHLLV